MEQPKGEQLIWSTHRIIYNFATYFCDAEKPKERPKLVKHTAQLISPQLLACKIETRTVEIPPALRQRNIQLQALESKRFVSEPIVVKVISVENGLKHRKKSTMIKEPTCSGGYTTTSDDDSGSDDNSIFETYLVVEFSPDIQRKTLHWIIDKIRRKTSHGGAGLLLRREPQNKYVDIRAIIFFRDDFFFIENFALFFPQPKSRSNRAFVGGKLQIFTNCRRTGNNEANTKRCDEEF